MTDKAPRRPWLLAATLLVAACGVAATAHGLYAVAVASGVPTAIAVLYPVIADGLAVVAYGATRWLGSVRYPWLVVIVAAGLSGLAQGVNLRGFGVPGEWLRFGVGMAPAVAVLAVVHLLWLVSRRGEINDSSVHVDESSVHLDISQQPAGQVRSLAPIPGPPAPNGHAETKLARAAAAALAWQAEHDGDLPSENVLAGLAGCSRGTARNALVPMRRDA